MPISGMFNKLLGSFSGTSNGLDEREATRRHLSTGAEDVEKLDPNVASIEMPTSSSSHNPSHIRGKDVPKAVTGPYKKNKVISGFKPVNTLGKQSNNSVAQLALSGRLYEKGGVGARYRGLDHERPTKRQKFRDAELESESDAEDILSQGTNNKRLSGLKANNLRKPLNLRQPDRERLRGNNTYSTSEYSAIEKLTSFEQFQNGRKGRKCSTSFTSHLGEHIDPPMSKRTDQAAPSAKGMVTERREAFRVNHRTTSTDSKSPYFAKGVPSEMGNDASTAIEVDDPGHAEVVETPKAARGQEGEVLSNDMDASPDEISQHDLASKRREPLEPRTPRRQIRAAVIQGNDQILSDSAKLKKQDVTSRVSEESIVNETRFSITQYATDRQPKLQEGDFCLILKGGQYCVNLYLDGHNIEPDFVPLDFVQRFAVEESSIATRVFLWLSKRQGHPSKIALTCGTHRVFGRLVRLLEDRSRRASSWSPDKMDRVFRNLQTSQHSAIERSSLSDIDFIRDKRKREMDNHDEIEETPGTKKPKVKLRDQMKKPLEPQKDVGDHSSTNHSTRESPDPNSVGQPSLDKSHTDIDVILKTLQPEPRRASLRNRSGKGSSLDTSNVFENDTFPEKLRYSKSHGLGPKWKRPLTYPQQGKRKTNVEFDDLPKLDEGQCLNDSIIDFYLRYLVEQLQKDFPQMAKNVYFFNTYFYTSLKGAGSKINYDNVKKWTRNIDLFCHDYVVVPINENFHWYIAIICNLPSLSRKAPEIIGDSDVEPLVSNDDPKRDSTEVEQEGFQQKQQPIIEDEEMLVFSPVAEAIAPQETDLVSRPEESTRKSLSELKLDDDVDSHWSGFDTSRPLSNASESGEAPKNSVPPDTIEVKALIQSKEDLEHLSRDAPHPETSKNRPEVKAGLRKGKRKSIPRVYDPDVPAIITLDSLGLTHSPAIKALKLYLVEEAKEKRGGMTWEESDIQGMTGKGIPQQSNYCDCGLYLLGYMDKFIENPKKFVTSLLRKEFDEDKDWPELKPNEMRAQVRELIQKLHDEQESGRAGKSKKLPRASDTQLEAKSNPSRPKTPEQAGNHVPKEAIHEGNDSEQRIKETKISHGHQQQQQHLVRPVSKVLEVAKDASMSVGTSIPLTRKEALAAALPLDAPAGDDDLLDQVLTAVKAIARERTESLSDHGKEIVMVPDSQENLSLEASKEEAPSIQKDNREAEAKQSQVAKAPKPLTHPSNTKHAKTEYLQNSKLAVEIPRASPDRRVNRHYTAEPPAIRETKQGVGVLKRGRPVG